MDYLLSSPFIAGIFVGFLLGYLIFRNANKLPSDAQILNNVKSQIKVPTSDQKKVNQQVMELLHSGKKIAAIKLVREQLGLGLLEAKNYVEALEQGRPLL